MSFYGGHRRLGQFGILPVIAAAMPMVQGMMSSQPLDTSNPYAYVGQTPPPSPMLIGAAVVGGLGIAGGILYMLWMRR